MSDPTREALIDIATEAFYRAHVNMVYHSQKGRERVLANADARHSWRPAIAAAVDAIAPTLSTTPAPDLRAEIAEVVQLIETGENRAMAAGWPGVALPRRAGRPRVASSVAGLVEAPRRPRRSTR